MAEKKKKTNRPTSAKEDIINRVYVLYAAFIVVGLLLAGRIIQVQVADKNVDKHIAVMEKNITNIMLVGQNWREDEQNKLSDTMILCSINRKTKTMTMVSFLRDLYAPLPGICS